MSIGRLEVMPPLPPSVYVRRRATRLPFPLDQPGCVVFARARHGLWHGVAALGLGAEDEILVPAYHHGSEVAALVGARLTCRFYEGTETLEPDQRELEALLGSRTKALYLIHYLGFPQDSARWRRWCDEHGLLLFEDAAQAWLGSVSGRPLGSWGDLAIFCLYKTFGIPDGGALLLRAPPPEPDGARSLGVRGAVRGHVAWTMARSRRLATRRPLALQRGRYVPERDFALNDPSTTASAVTRLLLPRLVSTPAAARRRANYELLLDELHELVPEPFCRLPPGASPFAFPVETEDKAELLARLARDQVKALDLWSVAHPSLPEAGFPAAAARRKRTVALPVHQELRREDTERLARIVGGRRRRPPSWQLERLASVDDIAEEWDSLAQTSGNVFSTYEWLSTWWRHFGNERPLLATACRERGGRLVAILPLYLASDRPLRIVRFVGHGASDQLGPICAPGARIGAARALRRALRASTEPWDLFVGQELRADEGWSSLLGARTLGRLSNPVLRLSTANWNDFLRAQSSSLRKAIAYNERRLAREHDVRYRLAADPRLLEGDLDTLFDLHRRRWQKHESPFIEREGFHREFAARALERGWLRLWILEVDGEPAAAWYGFRFAGIESHYQSGRDLAYDRSSIGSIVLAHAIRKAVDDGMREFRFLRGGEPYKYRFATEDPGLETVAFSRGMLGAAVLAARAAAGARTAAHRASETGPGTRAEVT